MPYDVEVNSWTGLMTAIDDAAYSGRWGESTIRLTSDINMNTETPEGVKHTVSSFSNDNSGTLVIDGQGHKIQNLRTDISSPGDILYLSSSLGTMKTAGLHWKNTDFVNIILAGGSFFNYNTSKFNLTFQMTNCRFVGSRSGTAYLVGTTPTGAWDSLTFTSCFFDIPWQGAGMTNLSCTSLIPKVDNYTPNVFANYCWFREKYTGWVWYGGTISPYYHNSGYPRFFSFSYMKINGCYIDGKTQLPTMTEYNGYGAFMGYFLHRNIVQNFTPSVQNVFDVELTTNKLNNYYWPANAVYYSSLSGVVKKAATAPDGQSCTWVDYRTYADGSSSYPNPILATPEQMKDATWLSSAGFDIIIPSE